MIRDLSDTISQPNTKINAYIAGGIAISYWLDGMRSSNDLDVIFSHRFFIKEGLFRKYTDPDNIENSVFFDYNFNPMFSLIQADYHERAHLICEYDNINVYVLSPEDIALMKASRYKEKDKWDILKLAEAGLLDKNKIQDLADDALKDFIGDPVNIIYSIKYIIDTIKSVEANIESLDNEVVLPCP